ncbi:MAG: FHA domain-containing protein [Acidobacteriota bacterium]
MVLCSNCKSQNAPGSNVCAKCGAALPEEITSATAGTPILVVRWPGGKTEEHALVKASTRVGRGLNNEIVLDFPTVSGNHLELQRSAGQLLVVDLGSTNGTQLNGYLITPKVPYTLLTGDVLRVGDFTGNSVSMGLKPPVEEAGWVREVGSQDLSDFPRVIIGRDPDTQLHLEHATVSRRHAEIVRQDSGHAILDLGSANGTFVNGRRVSGSRMLAVGDVIQIGPFRFTYDGRLERLTTVVSRGHRLDAVGVGVQVADGRMILRDVSLSIAGGEFVALVGGSGAGKSTLLKAMNGYNPASHGRMLIDGKNLYENLDAYRNLMGFVPQDDIIHKELPVRRALWHAARLRLPDASGDEIRKRVDEVLATLELTEHADKPVRVLSGGQRKRVSIAVELLAQPVLLFLDEPTSGLDPGLEKKMMYDLNRLADQGRTVVLVTHATGNIEQCHHVAFLAEGRLAYYGPPRDAISFFLARDFSDIYLKLSKENEPERARLLPPGGPTDSPDGRLHAPGQAGATPRGPSLSPAEVWADHYQHSDLYKEYVGISQSHIAAAAQAPAEPAPKPVGRARDSVLRQIWVLARRQFDLIRHDWRTLFVLLAMMPIIAGMFAAVSGPSDLVGTQLNASEIDEELKADVKGAAVGETAEFVPAPTAIKLITMLCLALTQAGTFGAAYEIVKERAIFKRERAVNLRVLSYLSSKVMVLGAFAVLQVACALVILGLRVDFSFSPILDALPNASFELFVTLLLAVLASIAFGLFISAVVPTADIVLYVILIQLFVQIILAGTLFPLPDNPASRLMISRWSIDAVGATVGIRELNDQSRVCRVIEVPETKETITNCSAAAISEKDLSLPYTHTREHLLTCWGALLAQALAWGLLTMIVQARKKID